MQRSSESIAKLACALAKAQIELINPEKSQVGTIRLDGAGPEGRRFNYASLASGLDIVRKTLGQHEIATVQTTAIDEASGIVELTTVLAHSSGEWIASDWPVCAVAETATPHRMGAALTYARRYALFTLVGIAGEDDLDAPDLQNPTGQIRNETPKGAGNGHVHRGGGKPLGSHWNSRPAARTRILPCNESAALRDRLLAEIDMFDTADDAALWAQRHLPEKNKLAAADAQGVEQAFAAKLASLTTADADQSAARGSRKPRRDRSRDAQRFGQTSGRNNNNLPQHHEDRSPSLRAEPNAAAGPRQWTKRKTAIDKSVLAVPEPRRIRDRDHVKFVATQACLICGRRPSDAHHLRFAQSRALGRKVSDEFTVPLCRGHHREVHRRNDEPAWWSKAGIDAIKSARALWLQTHPLPTTAATAAEIPAGSSPHLTAERC